VRRGGVRVEWRMEGWRRVGEVRVEWRRVGGVEDGGRGGGGWEEGGRGGGGVGRVRFIPLSMLRKQQTQEQRGGPVI
jgi:hypothetical protein